MSRSDANPMPNLYRRLRAVGLTKPYVRETILPDWWDDQVAINPAGYAEGLAFLSRHLGLDLKSLKEPDGPMTFRDFGVCKFKKSKNALESELALARAMATRVAQLADAAMTESPQPLPCTAMQMRQEILGQGAPWVDLNSLLDYCWSLGIPVIHLSAFPKTKRPDGLSARVRGRPVIVLCQRAKSSARQLFVLAYELGHIALGHVEDNGALLDESMDRNEPDQEEKDANQFALELLTGDEDCRFFADGRWPNARDLAKLALKLGQQLRIDPGHIVLSYAHTMGDEFRAVANAALKLLEPEPSALSVIQTKMAEQLDWSSLPEDSSEFFMRVSQASSASDLLNR